MVENYIKRFAKLRTDTSPTRWSAVTRHRAPHKPLLLLAVMDLFAQGSVTTNLIELTADLGELFTLYWARVMPPDRRGNLALPFFHLKSDGFWHLVPRSGKEAFLAATRQIRSVNQLRATVLGAQLDDELCELLCAEESRNLLRAMLIETYFASEVQPALVEQGNINAEAFRYSQTLLEQARKRQVKEGLADGEGYRSAARDQRQGLRPSKRRSSWRSNMGYKVWGVRYPHMVFDIIGHALEHGMVDFGDTRIILTPVKNKTYAEGYLNMCLLTGLLRALTGDWRPKRGKFTPTYRGRYFYRAAQKNRDAAVRELLGSIPCYRFHAELLLAELIMTTTLRSAPQAGNIIAHVSQVLPWFMGDRLLWIQQSVNWVDSSSYNARDLWTLRRKIHKLNTLGRFIQYSAYPRWDEYLGFTKPTDLTQVENLCRFLAEQRQRHLYVGRQFLSRQALAVLLLLMLAEGEGLSVDASRWPKAIEELLHLGVDIRRRDDRAYLLSAVKVILPAPSGVEELSLANLDDDNPLGVFNHLVAVAKQSLAASPTRAVLSLDLKVLRQRVKETMGRHNLFVPTELSDADDVTTPSNAEIWRVRPLWHQVEADFHKEVCKLCQPQSTAVPSADVLLTRNQLTALRDADLEAIVTRNPHLYVLLMLLIDQPQSHTSPTLKENVWHSRGIELFPALDALLRTLGYTVWSEGYEYEPETRIEMARQLVGILVELRVAAVQFGRLELTESFKHALQMDYAYLANQTRYIRRRLRQPVQNLVVPAG